MTNTLLKLLNINFFVIERLINRIYQHKSQCFRNQLNIFVFDCYFFLNVISLKLHVVCVVHIWKLEKPS